MQRLRVGVREVEELQVRVRRLIERFARFGLGGLEHQRLVHDQREVHRRRVHAAVDRALGDVHGAHAGFLPEPGQVEHEFVHAYAGRGAGVFL